jgi:hypothetical protein
MKPQNKRERMLFFITEDLDDGNIVLNDYL